VIVVHQDYEEQQGRMEDVLHAYIGDPRTKVVLVEYFEPEIKENVARIPVAGKILSEILAEEKNSPRFAFAREVTNACQQEGKPIAVADIANKPFYYVDALIPLLLAYAVPPVGIPATTEYLFRRQYTELCGKSESGILDLNTPIQSASVQIIPPCFGRLDKKMKLNNQGIIKISAYTYANTHNSGQYLYHQREEHHEGNTKKRAEPPFSFCR